MRADFLWRWREEPKEKGGGETTRETESIISIIIVISIQAVGGCDDNDCNEIYQCTEPRSLIVKQKTMAAPGFTQSLISESGLQSCQLI